MVALQGLIKPVSRARHRGQAHAACYLSNAKRLDPATGFCSPRTSTCLFARQLLSFKLQRDDFRSVVAPREQPVAAKLGITPDMPLASSARSPGSMSRIVQYMADHLTRFRQKKADTAASS